MKRVFTVVLDGVYELAAAASPPTSMLVQATFKAEEDIVVIGVHGWMEVATPLIGNDGWAAAVFELTPNAGFGQPGSIMQLGVAELWNTSPAAVQIMTTNEWLVLPEGLGISVKEEGVLNMLAQGWNTSAATCRFSPHYFIYYIKGVKVLP